MYLDEQFLWDRIGFFWILLGKKHPIFPKGFPQLICSVIGLVIILPFSLFSCFHLSFLRKEGLSQYSVIILSLS